MVTRGDKTGEARSHVVAQLASEFLQDALRKVVQIPGEFERAPDLRAAAHTDFEGYLRVMRVLPGGFRLSIAMYVDTAGRTPSLRKYSFHLQDAEGRCIVRFDNAPHHRDLSAFPHHKHVGPDQRVEESGPPDLVVILDEIRRHVPAD